MILKTFVYARIFLTRWCPNSVVDAPNYGDAVVSIEFAKAFARHVDCPSESVAGTTVGEALAAYVDLHPAVRGYVLDDVGAVRNHVAIFHNDDLVSDRISLADPVADGDRIQVFQALSGG
jgi:molybdopterin converting factor small subunit